MRGELEETLQEGCLQSLVCQLRKRLERDDRRSTIQQQVLQARGQEHDPWASAETQKIRAICPSQMAVVFDFATDRLKFYNGVAKGQAVTKQAAGRKGRGCGDPCSAHEPGDRSPVRLLYPQSCFATGLCALLQLHPMWLVVGSL